jgi:hypothetical protein
VLGVLAPCLAACSPGVQWRGYTFDPVHTAARRDGKLTFVYFRHWAVIACTEFEENVLKQPAVLEALQPAGPLYATALDFQWDRPLADRWGIEAPPAVVILDAEQRVLARLAGKITVGQLLEAIEAARSRPAPETQPGRGP